MTRRWVMTLLAVLLTLTACSQARARVAPPPDRCTPPAGGRCAADVAWPGPIEVSADGRRLHGIVLCGGTLRVVGQTPDRVTLRLHVGAMGPGTMSCARVDVGARLAKPLAGRAVYDAVSGRRLAVGGPGSAGLSGPTLRR
jgi:hypothetical protein